jgi:PPOX class probable F420-dependent enzyme
MSILRDADVETKAVEEESAVIDWTSKLGREAKRLLAREYFVWFTTVASDLSPQPRPVWFIWDHDSVLVYSQAWTHKVQHVSAHPRAALHFNADDEAEGRVVIFVGTARIDPEQAPAHLVAKYMRKYRSGIQGLGMTPQQFSKEYSVAIRITPTSLRSG